MKTLVVTEENDDTTALIVEWLVHKGAEVTQINVEDAVNSLSIEVGNYTEIDSFDLSAFQSVLIRRGFIRLSPFLSREIGLGKSFFFQIKRETSVVENYIDKQLSQLKCTGQSILYNGDKLQTLALAKEVGLYIPDTLVTTQKSKLRLFKAKHQEIITKTIDTQFHFHNANQNETYMLYTN